MTYSKLTLSERVFLIKLLIATFFVTFVSTYFFKLAKVLMLLYTDKMSMFYAPDLIIGVEDLL